MDGIAKAILGALGAGVLGWVANSLTLVGEVRALTASVARVEARMDASMKLQTQVITVQPAAAEAKQ